MLKKDSWGKKVCLKASLASVCRLSLTTLLCLFLFIQVGTGVSLLWHRCVVSLLPPIFLSLKTETGMAVMHRIGLEGNFKLSFYLRAVHFQEI